MLLSILIAYVYASIADVKFVSFRNVSPLSFSHKGFFVSMSPSDVPLLPFCFGMGGYFPYDSRAAKWGNVRYVNFTYTLFAFLTGIYSYWVSPTSSLILWYKSTSSSVNIDADVDILYVFVLTKPTYFSIWVMSFFSFSVFFWVLNCCFSFSSSSMIILIACYSLSFHFFSSYSTEVSCFVSCWKLLL